MHVYSHKASELRNCYWFNIRDLHNIVAYRGLYLKLFSDNATNFVGANKELSKLHNLDVKPDTNLAKYMSTEGIDLNFLPLRAPNFGSL